MARFDSKSQTDPQSVSQGRSQDLADARKAAMSQARARSMARAQSIARAQALKKEQANARLRMMFEEELAAQQASTPAENASAATEAEQADAVSEEIPMVPAEPANAVEAAEEAPVAESEETPEEEAGESTEETTTEEPNAEEPDAEEPDAEAEDAVDENGNLKFAIRIRDLHKSYGTKSVLKGLNLDVYPGEMFGFIGRNGVGKSTTIDCMIGAKRFDSGEITVGGYDISREPLDAKYSYGYVASEPTCYEVMTGYDYLEFVASIYGLTETEFTGNYKYLCTRLQLDLAELSHHISGYSHGMKQKLCLVASLLHNPNLWILDEPTVGLDIMAQEELKKMMREYANHGKTVFVTSHNIEMVSAICDRVAIINHGVVQAVYDLNKNPAKRNELARIFIETYGG